MWESISCHDWPGDAPYGYRVRWSIPDKERAYLWVGHYYAGSDASIEWCEHAAERHAERLNEQLKQPWEFQAGIGMEMSSIKEHEGSKYLTTIRSATTPGSLVEADVYEVLLAFKITCPATQHAIKKLLFAGQRGKGTREQDLVGARAAIDRAIELEKREVRNRMASKMKEEK